MEKDKERQSIRTGVKLLFCLLVLDPLREFSMILRVFFAIFHAVASIQQSIPVSH